MRLTAAPQDPKIYFQSDLPKFVLNEKAGKDGMLGDGKFMKTYCMRVDGVQLVVKVYMKSPDEDLSPMASRLTSIWQTLSPTRYPNLLPYQLWIRSISRQKTVPTPIYLVRQHLAASLFERVLTRPFLDPLEKQWLMFQLFKSLELCHSHGVVHGDLKPENIMCTTWNFVILTDFASFKPTLIPDDDPTDFQYYFDSMGRRACYVAPERFVKRNLRGRATSSAVSLDEAFSGGDRDSTGTRFGTVPRAALTASMDIFSLGCTLAEVCFLLRSNLVVPFALPCLC